MRRSLSMAPAPPGKGADLPRWIPSAQRSLADAVCGGFYFFDHNQYFIKRWHSAKDHSGLRFARQAGYSRALRRLRWETRKEGFGDRDTATS
jgi:hypothetical protein